jgi:predicted deacylase
VSAAAPKNYGETTAELISGIEVLARGCPFITRRKLGIGSGDALFTCRVEGPKGGGEPLRIGIFSGIHGDEPAGPYAVLELVKHLVRNPEVAVGYELHLFPVCNPHGFDRRSRYSSSGRDLNREFWRGSVEPEVRVLEKEILEKQFHGLISLHADDTSDGVYGFVRGDVLSRSLLAPALAASEKFLPRNSGALIDGFPAENGIISECYDGILTSPPRLANTPWEIIFETPQRAEMEKQIDASLAAILSILSEYRKFIAFAADL